MNPTDTQIGGNHYKKAIQPVEYIHANNLNFFEGNVIKYITRHREKGGKLDLQKAIHYIEMLMQFEYPDSTGITENAIAEENLKGGDIVSIKDSKAYEVNQLRPFMVDNIGDDGVVYFSDGRVGFYDPKEKSWSITYSFKQQ